MKKEKNLWPRWGSNQRPPEQTFVALPAELQSQSYME